MKTTRNLLPISAALFGAVVLTGCAYGPNLDTLPAGGIYTDMILPVQATGTRSDTAGSGPGILKRGTGTCKNVLLVAAWGDCSIHSAATSAGITNIKTVDWRYSSYVGPIYHSYTVIVTGD